jgi:hypothetical protein
MTVQSKLSNLRQLPVSGYRRSRFVSVSKVELAALRIILEHTGKLEGVGNEIDQPGRVAICASDRPFRAAASLLLVDTSENDLASLMPASWNQIACWLRTVDELRRAA